VADGAGSHHDAGAAMHALVAELYPFCRSITGDGVRATLRAIGARIPLDLHEVPTGTAVLFITRVGYVASGKAVELTHSYCRSDYYDFVAEMRRE
jgi:GntR family transcriptional regulator